MKAVSARRGEAAADRDRHRKRGREREREMASEEPKNLWEGTPNPDPWTAAEHNVLNPEDGHWEYQVRKSQNEGKGTGSNTNEKKKKKKKKKKKRERSGKNALASLYARGRTKLTDNVRYSAGKEVKAWCLCVNIVITRVFAFAQRLAHS